MLTRMAISRGRQHLSKNSPVGLLGLEIFQLMGRLEKKPFGVPLTKRSPSLGLWFQKERRLLILVVGRGLVREGLPKETLRQKKLLGSTCHHTLSQSARGSWSLRLWVRAAE